MNELTKNVYTTDDIHEMRLKVAEQYRSMTNEEAERDFKQHVENAKKTMDALRER